MVHQYVPVLESPIGGAKVECHFFPLWKVSNGIPKRVPSLGKSVEKVNQGFKKR